MTRRTQLTLAAYLGSGYLSIGFLVSVLSQVAFALTLICFTATGCFLYTGVALKTRRPREIERAADRELERARYAQMSHLSAADERWLAERHFFVVPKEVARIREGLPWDELVFSDSPDYMRPAIQNRVSLEKRAEAARKMFHGDNLNDSPRHMQDRHLNDAPQVITGDIILPREDRPQSACRHTKGLAKSYDGAFCISCGEKVTRFH